MNTLNETVLKIMKEYPTDGTHGYHWVNGFDGATRDLYYMGNTIMKANEAKQTYCCGLTLEVYLRAAHEHRINLGSLRDVFDIKSNWFCATGKHENITDYTGPVEALVPKKLGFQVDRKDAKAGDFAQIWRASGSGHSIILTDIIISNVDYWSTQKATKGIGYRKEYFFGDTKNPITDIYIVRAYGDNFQGREVNFDER